MNEASQFHTDSKKDNENRRKQSRLSVIDNIIVKLTVLFRSIEKEVEAASGLYDLKRKINNIANLGQKLTTLEWKKAVRKALGINLLDDYYSGDIYKDLLEKWVSDNVDLIKTAQSNSLDKMKEIVYQNYMKGTTTARCQYGLSQFTSLDIKIVRKQQWIMLLIDCWDITVVLWQIMKCKLQNSKNEANSKHKGCYVDKITIFN